MTTFEEQLKLAQTKLDTLNLRQQAHERKLQDFQFTCGMSICLSGTAFFLAVILGWSFL